MATYSSIPVWRIPWTEEPGGLQSMGSQRVRHSWATEQQQSSYIYSACHYLPWHISLCTYYLLPLSKYKCLMGSKLALLTAVSPVMKTNLALTRHSVNRCYMNKWMKEWMNEAVRYWTQNFLSPKPVSLTTNLNQLLMNESMNLKMTEGHFTQHTMLGLYWTDFGRQNNVPKHVHILITRTCECFFMSQKKVIVDVIKFRTEMWGGYPGLHSGPNPCTQVLKSRESLR